MSDWVEAVTEILFESSFMTLATADVEGRPWASPVEFACDENLRFYLALRGRCASFPQCSGEPLGGLLDS